LKAAYQKSRNPIIRKYALATLPLEAKGILMIKAAENMLDAFHE
jgi:hypothetical protein